MVDTLAELIQHGHDVSRWHTIPTLKEQNLASHAWGVAMIINRLYDGTPESKAYLLSCALEHDLAEKHVGDMPRPGRSDEHRQKEAAHANDMGIAHESTLNPEQRLWLDWADTIEAGLHAQREINLGNRHYNEILLRINGYLEEHEYSIPPALVEFARSANLML